MSERAVLAHVRERHDYQARHGICSSRGLSGRGPIAGPRGCSPGTLTGAVRGLLGRGPIAGPGRSPRRRPWPTCPRSARPWSHHSEENLVLLLAEAYLSAACPAAAPTQAAALLVHAAQRGLSMACLAAAPSQVVLDVGDGPSVVGCPRPARPRPRRRTRSLARMPSWTRLPAACQAAATSQARDPTAVVSRLCPCPRTASPRLHRRADHALIGSDAGTVRGLLGPRPLVSPCPRPTRPQLDRRVNPVDLNFKSLVFPWFVWATAPRQVLAPGGRVSGAAAVRGLPARPHRSFKIIQQNKRFATAVRGLPGCGPIAGGQPTWQVPPFTALSLTSQAVAPSQVDRVHAVSKVVDPSAGRRRFCSVLGLSGRGPIAGVPSPPRTGPRPLSAAYQATAPSQAPVQWAQHLLAVDCLWPARPRLHRSSSSSHWRTIVSDCSRLARPRPHRRTGTQHTYLRLEALSEAVAPSQGQGPCGHRPQAHVSAVCPAAAPSQVRPVAGAGFACDGLRGLPGRGPIAGCDAPIGPTPRHPLSAAPSQAPPGGLWDDAPGAVCGVPGCGPIAGRRRSASPTRPPAVRGLPGRGPMAGATSGRPSGPTRSAVRGLSGHGSSQQGSPTGAGEECGGCPWPAGSRPHRRDTGETFLKYQPRLSVVWPAAGPSQVGDRQSVCAGSAVVRGGPIADRSPARRCSAHIHLPAFSPSAAPPQDAGRALGRTLEKLSAACQAVAPSPAFTGPLLGQSILLSAVCPAVAPSQGYGVENPARAQRPVRGLPGCGPIAGSHSRPPWCGDAVCPRPDRPRPHHRYDNPADFPNWVALSSACPAVAPSQAAVSAGLERDVQLSAACSAAAPSQHVPGCIHHHRRVLSVACPAVAPLQDRVVHIDDVAARVCPQPARPWPHRRSSPPLLLAADWYLSAACPAAAPSQALHAAQGDGLETTVRGLLGCGPIAESPRMARNRRWTRLSAGCHAVGGTIPATVSRIRSSVSSHPSAAPSQHERFPGEREACASVRGLPGRGPIAGRLPGRTPCALRRCPRPTRPRHHRRMVAVLQKLAQAHLSAARPAAAPSQAPLPRAATRHRPSVRGRAGRGPISRA